MMMVMLVIIRFSMFVCLYVEMINNVVLMDFCGS